MRVSLALVLSVGGFIGGCASLSRRHDLEHQAAGRQAVPPRVVKAWRIGASSPGGFRYGSPVPGRDLGPRVFSDRLHGFALTLRLLSWTYPAVTLDGGRSWHIAGPVLHIAAAQGAIAVAEAGVEGPHFYYAWGGGGNQVVDVTTDGGSRWWRTFLPGEVLFVDADELEGRLQGGLTATVASPAPGRRNGGAGISIYHTQDGRLWRPTGS
jgi:hypothetical protein